MNHVHEILTISINSLIHVHYRIECFDDSNDNSLFTYAAPTNTSSNGMKQPQL